MEVLRALPRELVFADVAEDKAYSRELIVQNVGRKSHRVSLVEPQIEAFAVTHLGTGSAPWKLAPGMSLSFTVEFMFEDVMSMRDAIVFAVEGSPHKLRVPLQARLPQAQFSFPRHLSFGTVVSSSKVHTRTFALRNDGGLDGSFEMRLPPGLPFTVKPVSGKLAPEGDVGSTQRVRVDFDSSTAGKFSGSLPIVVNGVDAGTLELQAVAEMQRLRLIPLKASQASPEELTHLDMGCLHYSTKRTHSAVLWNQGPQAVSFVLVPQAHQVWQHSETGKALDVAFDVTRAIQPSPAEGVLGPNEKVRVEFTFCPTVKSAAEGFQMEEIVEPRRDFLFQLAATAVGTNQTPFSFDISASAVPPLYKLSSTTLSFGACGTGETQETVLVIENRSTQLPLTFGFPDVAHFCMHPASGIILPSSQQRVILSFKPNQLGDLSRRTNLLLAEGSLVVPLEFQATCTYDGAPFAKRTGVAAQAGPPSQAFRFGKTPAASDKTPMSDPSGKQVFGVHPTAPPTALPKVPPAQQIRQSRPPRRADDYLRTASKRRAAREETVQIKPSQQPDNPVDLGIQSHAGLASPEPILPPIGQAKRKPPSARTTGGGNKTSKRRGRQASSALSTVGRGGAGVDTNVPLTPMQQYNIVLRSKPEIHFGPVCEGSTNIRQLEILNSSDRHVLLSIEAACVELSQCEPLQQTVAPSETALFNVVLANITSYSDRKINTAITYVINRRYRVDVPVSAAVQQPGLALSTASLSIPVGCRAFTLRSTASVTLTNRFAHDCPFSWLVHKDCSAFRITPDSGVVGPNESLACEFEYLPSFASPDEGLFLLKVPGNPEDQVLRVGASFSGAKFSVVQTRIDFKEVALGIFSTASVTLRNTGTADAYFRATSLAMRPVSEKAEVVPAEGCVPVGGQVELSVRYCPEKLGKFDGTLAMGVKGGAAQTLQLFGKAVQPAIAMPEAWRFDSTFCGGEARLPVQIHNKSGAKCTLTLDLSALDDFAILLPADAASKRVERLAPTTAGNGPDTAGPPALQRGLSTDSLSAAVSGRSGRPAGNAVQRGARYLVDLAAGETWTVVVRFSPRSVASYATQVPVLINSRLYKAVTLNATALSSPLVLSTRALDFGRCFLPSGGPRQFQELQITGQAKGVSPFTITNNLPEVFSIELVELNFEPEPHEEVEARLSENQPMTVRIGFTPDAAQLYEGSLELQAQGKRFASVAVTGWGADPYLSFDMPFLELLPVPTGTVSERTLYVEPHGIAAGTELLCRVMGSAPLDLDFPDGNVFHTGLERLPVTVMCVAQEPVDFRVTLQFCVGKDLFPLTVVGKSDNNLLTIFKFLSSDGSSMQTAMERWLSSFGAAKRQPISLPGSLTADCGRLAFDVVERLADRKIPNLPLIRPKIAKPGQLLNMFSALLKFLRASGALLADVTAELLLPAEEYGRWSRECAETMATAGVAHTPEGRARQQRNDHVEKHLGGVSALAWTTVMAQTINVFLVADITPASLFAQVPSLPGSQAAFEAEMKRQTATGMHGPEEHVLLAWLSHHLQRATGTTARVENFSDDLSDGLVVAAVLAAHCDFLSESVFADLHSHAVHPNQRRHNALRIVSALGKIGLEFPLAVDDLLNPHPCFMLLFCAFLYERLPMYLPADDPLTFPVALGGRVTRAIKVPNPSAEGPWTYKVLLHGDDNFSCARSITVPAESTASLAVSFDARFSTSSRCLVLLVGSARTGARGSVCAFSCCSQVTVPAAKAATEVKTPCYEARTVNLSVTNRVGKSGVFAIQVLESSALEATRLVKPKSLKGLQAGPFGDLFAVGHPASQETPRAAMWSNATSITLAEGETKSVPIQFLPTRLGAHHASVLLSNEKLGEMVFGVAGLATLPKPIDTLTWGLGLESSLASTLNVTYANPLKKRAMGLIPGEELGLDQTKSLAVTTKRGVMLSELVRLQILYSETDFFRGPDSVALKPAKADASGSVFAPQVSSSGLVKPLPATPIPIRVEPIGPGTYSCDVALVAQGDVRIYNIQADIGAEKGQADGATGAVQQAGRSAAAPKTSTRMSARLTSHRAPTSSYSEAAQKKRAQSSASVMESRVISLNATAFAPLQHRLAVNAPGLAQAVTYDVVTDLDCLSGDESFTAQPGAEPGVYEMAVLSQHSGLYLGSVQFVPPPGVDAPELEFELQIEVKRSAPVGVIKLSCRQWEAAQVDLAISNPANTEQTFQVYVEGERASEVIAPTDLALQTAELVSCSLSFVPSRAGAQSAAALVFSSALCGEFWYRLLLSSQTAPVVELDHLACCLGQTASTTLSITNPSASAVVLDVASDHSAFRPEHAQVELEASGTISLDVGYMPADLEAHEGRITVSCPAFGSRVYKLRGRGRAPEPVCVEVSAQAGEDATVQVPLLNPRPQAQAYEMALVTSAPDGTFTVLARKRLKLAPHERGVVPLLYSPSKVTSYTARLTVRELRKGGATFPFDIRGSVQMDKLQKRATVKAACKVAATKRIRVGIQGYTAGLGDVACTLVWDDDVTPAWRSSCTPAAVVIEEGFSHASVELSILAAKPGAASCILVLSTESGGEWRRPLRLEVQDGDPDDRIAIEAVGLNRASSVGFRLKSESSKPEAFRAYLLPGASPGISIHPQRGKLAATAGGTLFIATFKPTDYGKPAVARLRVETETAQWTYAITGKAPAYTPPSRSRTGTAAGPRRRPAKVATTS